MRIAILGWGSLIPKPRGLLLSGNWQPDGPILEIEFSRISGDGRLTLVIDPEGSEVRTYYAESARTELSDAICDLRIRESTSTPNVGICGKDHTINFSEKHQFVMPVIQTWLDQTQFDVVIWTDLESNYKEQRKVNFEDCGALAYLNSLSPVCRANARDYIIQAPPQTQTKFRRYLQSKGWL